MTKLPPEHSNVVRGVEIFSPGTHNGEAYTEQDVDEMVSAFGKLDFRPAIKIGHTKDTPGAPSYGWVENLRKVGGKLVADFTSMHDSVLDALRKQSYNTVSSEIYHNLQRGGKKFRRALKAVALLGAEVPAVANLVPLHKMEFASEGEFEKFTSADEKLDVPATALLEAVSERLTGLTKLFNELKETSTMDLKTLQARITALSEEVTELKKSDEDEDLEKIKGIEAQIKTLTEAAAALKSAEEMNTKTNEKVTAQATQIAQLQAADRARTIEAKVTALKVPAFAGFIRGLYTYAVEQDVDTKVKVFSKDKDGKEITSELSVVETVDKLVSELNAQTEKLFKALADAGVSQRQEGKDTDTSAALAVDKLTKEYMTKNPTVKSYSDAMTAVLLHDKPLAERYDAEQRGNAAAH